MIQHVAIIGAGTFSKYHINAYHAIPGIRVSAICAPNEAHAQAMAAEFQIPKVYTDYRSLLNDPMIEAVSVVTPTFTHGEIVQAALLAGKHVLCEKPPALTYQEALDNEKLAHASGKILMYGFAFRFRQVNQFLKQYIEAGNLGEIYYAEASRMSHCSVIGGWFRDKTKSGGGCLMDAAIHQLDLMLYFMNYPKVKSVRGFTSHVNSTLPERIHGLKAGYTSISNTAIPRTIESFATGYITFEGNKNLMIKAAHIANTPNPGTRFEILGSLGGASYADDKLKLLTIDSSDYFVESQPLITNSPNHIELEIRHFLDCCNGLTECICTPQQGSEIIRILNAIYESAETGREITF